MLVQPWRSGTTAVPGAMEGPVAKDTVPTVTQPAEVMI